MAKILILIFLILSLTACNDSPPQWVNESAAVNCGGANKIHQVFYDAEHQIGSVTCKNGIYYSISLQEDE